jgi:hypothetical protein
MKGLRCTRSGGRLSISGGRTVRSAEMLQDNSKWFARPTEDLRVPGGGSKSQDRAVPVRPGVRLRACAS